MSNRYQKYMQSVQPSDEFLLRLEGRMNRELRRSSPGLRLVVCAAAAAVLVLACTVLLRPAPPDILQQPMRPVAETLPSTAPDPTPEALPTATPEPSPAPTPTASASSQEEILLEIEMCDRELFTNNDVIREPRSILVFENNLIGSNDSLLVEIHQGTELNSVVIAPLRPGDAFWPVHSSDAVMQITDTKGNDVGYTELVQFYDEKSNTVKKGWKHTLYGQIPPEVPVNPVEPVLIPGIVRADNTSLRYGKNTEAPAVAVLRKDQHIGLAYRVGNWIYASTEPFCFGYETPVTGWIHVSEVLGAAWKMTLNQVDLLADNVNLRDKPDGKIIASLNKNSQVYYTGDTVPGKNGDWHYVSVNWLKETKGTQNGYISADYARLYVFPLQNELNMDSVVSASMNYTDTSPFGAQEQTVEGDKLTLLLDRLRNARSTSIHQTVCGEGAAFITLTYADGHTVDLPISGDGCTQVRHGDVTYDLKTDEERTERFLNDGGVNLADILCPIFDKIKFH